MGCATWTFAMIYTFLVKEIMQIVELAPAFLAGAQGQNSGKTEFEVASIKSKRPHRSERHNHGAVVWRPYATYQASRKTTPELARALSDQSGRLDKYDISMRWYGTDVAHAGNHPDGGFCREAGSDGGGVKVARRGRGCFRSDSVRRPSMATKPLAGLSRASFGLRVRRGLGRATPHRKLIAN